MDIESQKLVDNEIVPLLQSGDLALFLGAGVSIGTPSLNGKGIPSTGQLINRICKSAGYSDEDASEADLPTAIEKKGYEKRGIIPIQADAKEFFEYLFNKVQYQTPEKFLKRKAPHLSVKNTDASAWFVQNFESVSDQLKLGKSRHGLHSKFYYGDMPDWFYISNMVPAKFSIVSRIESEILNFENSKQKSKLISIVGSLGAGKTTAAMMAISSIASTHQNVYRFSGIDGIDTEYLWKVVKETKGMMTIFIDSASSQFYAVNELINNTLTKMTSCKLCILIEERTANYDRNVRHLHQIPSENISMFEAGNIDKINAKILLEKTNQLGIRFEKLEGLNEQNAIKSIVDHERGYKGDLLAALYDLSSRQSYKDKLSEEYTEIESDTGRAIFQTISLVTASRLTIPIDYLAECHSLSVNRLMKIINSDLKGKVRLNEQQLVISARHHSIAEFHIEHNFDKECLKERIIDLMICLSNKFTIQDIKKHPISYRIYREILSFHYLSEVLFKSSKGFKIIHEIYSVCQDYYSHDGVFWLQYGRFLERDRDIPNAIHCFRRGLALYDSFQIRHALGQLLLNKYLIEGLVDRNEYDEGLKLLLNEVQSRGTTDPYPYTALCNALLKILNVNPDDLESLNKLKEVMNNGLRFHRTDSIFMKIMEKYSEQILN